MACLCRPLVRYNDNDFESLLNKKDNEMSQNENKEVMLNAFFL